jgi:hypothetical protein
MQPDLDRIIFVSVLHGVNRFALYSILILRGYQVVWKVLRIEFWRKRREKDGDWIRTI